MTFLKVYPTEHHQVKNPSERLLAVPDLLDLVEGRTGIRPSRKSIYRYVSTGVLGVRLPASRILGRLYFDRLDVEAFLAATVQRLNDDQRCQVPRVRTTRNTIRRDDFLRREGVLTGNADEAELGTESE